MIAERAPGFAPRLGIVLGSGLGGLADGVEDAIPIPYAELPGFPAAGVAGHGGRLVLGRLGGLPVACSRAAAHVYEGGDPGAMRAPGARAAAAGAERAAGHQRRRLAAPRVARPAR